MPRRRQTETSWDSDEDLLEDEVTATPNVITKTTKVTEASDDEELDEAALLGLDDDDDVEVMIHPQTQISTRSSITKEPVPSRRPSSTSLEKPTRVPPPSPVKEVKRAKQVEQIPVKQEIVTPIAVSRKRIVVNKTPVSLEKIPVAMGQKSPIVERKMIIVTKTSPVVVEKPLPLVERKPVVFVKKTEVLVKKTPDQAERKMVLEDRKPRLSDLPLEVPATKKTIVATPVINKPVLVRIKHDLQLGISTSSVSVAPKMAVASVNVKPKRLEISANVPAKIVSTPGNITARTVSTPGNIPARTVLAPVNIPQPKKVTASVHVQPKIVSTTVTIPPKMVSTSVNVAPKPTSTSVKRPPSPIRLPMDGENRDKKPTMISTKIKRPPSPIRMPEAMPATAKPTTATGLSVSLQKRLAVPISQSSEPTTGKVIKLNRAMVEPSDRQQSIIPPRPIVKQEVFGRLSPAYSHGATQISRGQAHLSRMPHQDYQLRQMETEVDYEDVLQLDTDESDAIFLDDGQYTDSFSVDAQVQQQQQYGHRELNRGGAGSEFMEYGIEEVEENVPGPPAFHPPPPPPQDGNMNPEASSDSESDKEDGHRGRFTSERLGAVSVAAPITARGYIPDTLEISDEQQATIDQFMIDGKGRGYHGYQRQRGPRRQPLIGRQPTQPFLRSQRYPFQSHDQQPRPFLMPGQIQTNFPPPSLFQEQQQQQPQQNYLPGQPLQIPTMHHPSAVDQMQPQYLHPDQQPQQQFVNTHMATPPPLERFEPSPADELDRFLGRPHRISGAGNRPRGPHIHPLDALLATSNQVRPPAPQPLLAPDIDLNQKPTTILINPHFRGANAGAVHVLEEAHVEQPVIQQYEVPSPHQQGPAHPSFSSPRQQAHPSFSSPPQQAIQSIGTRQPQLTPEQMRVDFPPPELPPFFGGQSQGGQIKVIQQQGPPQYGQPVLQQHQHPQQQQQQHQGNSIPVQFTSPPPPPPPSSSHMINRQHFPERVVIDPVTGQPHQPVQRQVGASLARGGYVRGAGPQQAKVHRLAGPGYGGYQKSSTQFHSQQILKRSKQTLMQQQRQNAAPAAIPAIHAQKRASASNGATDTEIPSKITRVMVRADVQALVQRKQRFSQAPHIEVVKPQPRKRQASQVEAQDDISAVASSPGMIAKLEEQKRQREAIIQTKELRREAMADIRRQHLEEQLAKQGRTLRDLVPAEVKEEQAASIQKKATPQQAQVPQKQAQQQRARRQSNTQQQGQGKLNTQPAPQTMPAVQRGKHGVGRRGARRGGTGRGVVEQGGVGRGISGRGSPGRRIMGRRGTGRGQGRGQTNAQVTRPPNVKEQAHASEVAIGRGLPLQRPVGLSQGQGSRKLAAQRNAPRGRGFQLQSPRGGSLMGRGSHQQPPQGGPVGDRGGQQEQPQTGAVGGRGILQQPQSPQSGIALGRGILQQPLGNIVPGGLLQHPPQSNPVGGRGFMQRPPQGGPGPRGPLLGPRPENLSGERPMHQQQPPPTLMDVQGGRGRGFFQRGFMPPLLQPPTLMNMQGRPRFPPALLHDGYNQFRRGGPMENNNRQMGFSQRHLLGNMAHAMNEQLRQQFQHMTRGRAGPPQRMQQDMGRGRPGRGGRGPTRYGGPPQNNTGIRGNIPSPEKHVKLEGVNSKDVGVPGSHDNNKRQDIGGAVKREAGGDASQVKQLDRVVSMKPGSHGDDKRQVLASAGRGSAVSDRTVVVRSAQKSTQKSCTVSIGNLSSSTNETTLNQMCSTVGTAQSISLNKGHRHAVVRLSTPEEAQKFLRKYNRHMLDLSHLTVKLEDS